jgi:hypothetical protein
LGKVPLKAVPLDTLLEGNLVKYLESQMEHEMDLLLDTRWDSLKERETVQGSVKKKG